MTERENLPAVIAAQAVVVLTEKRGSLVGRGLFALQESKKRELMREMRTVKLLTREKEIEIAKRIEDGLKHMIQAISTCPATIAEILCLAEKIEHGQLRIDELIEGFVYSENEMVIGAEGDEESLGDEAAANLAQLKTDALARFAAIADLFAKMGKAYEKYGYRSKQYDKFQFGISAELMSFRFSAKQVDALCATMRGLADEVRRSERGIQELCVTKGMMPHTHFIKTFPGNEGNLQWVAQELKAKKPYGETLARHQHAIVEQQKRLLDLQRRVGIPIRGLKEIIKQMTVGEEMVCRAKRDMIEASNAAVLTDATILESLRGATASILGSLTQLEANVLRIRFGIQMNTSHTLEEVGKQFDVTPEHIRQIEAKALRKLRHPSRSEYWYREAAEEGNAGGQFNLGREYWSGEDVLQAYVEALKWYRLAAEQGNAMAQEALRKLGIDWEK